MSHGCVAVLTARGPDRLLAEGGSQAWRLNPGNARQMAYCVCVQNRSNGHWGGASEEHHLAFMIGRISAVVPSPERGDRYMIKFSEYAKIKFRDAWSGRRNPVYYGTLEEFGITDPNSLNWQPMPTPDLNDSPSPNGDRNDIRPLTIAAAKMGLALGLGVPESAIEIVIKF